MKYQVEIKKETLKAVCVSMTLLHPKTGGTFNKSQWFPKSVMRIINHNLIEVDDWFANKLMNDICTQMKLAPVMSVIMFKHTKINA